MSKNKSKKLSCISLFSGAGGLDIGLECVGFNTLLSTDIDYHSCISLEMGSKIASSFGFDDFHKLKVLRKDICDLSAQEILDLTNIRKGELDLLAGGPPCQAFSVFGKRQGREDPRGKLVFEYLRILSGLEPNAFVLENVYGLLTIENGAVLRDLMGHLEKPNPGLSYNLNLLRLNAVDYGVPQFRDRVFIIGCKNNSNSVIMKPTFTGEITDLTLPKWRTVLDGFRGLPKLGDGELSNHVGRVHSERIINRYHSLRPGQRDPLTRINKLDLNRPSFTIIVGSDKGGGKGHVHPIEPREVSPRESARIQTFPDWWKFSGTSRHPIRQVGNAVPPLLGAVVGNAIRSQLFNKKPIILKDIIKKLCQTHLIPNWFNEDDTKQSSSI